MNSAMRSVANSYRRITKHCHEYLESGNSLTVDPRIKAELRRACHKTKVRPIVLSLIFLIHFLLLLFPIRSLILFFLLSSVPLLLDLLRRLHLCLLSYLYSFSHPLSLSRLPPPFSTSALLPDLFRFRIMI